MKTTRFLSTITLLAALALAGCNNNPVDPGTDGGRDAAARDTGTNIDDGGADSGVDSSTPGVDGGSDAGCTSTMTNCNSCTTPATDPFNACSSAVTNCVPFDNATRVPGWPDSIPMITP